MQVVGHQHQRIPVFYHQTLLSSVEFIFKNQPFYVFKYVYYLMMQCAPTMCRLH